MPLKTGYLWQNIKDSGDVLRILKRYPQVVEIAAPPEYEGVLTGFDLPLFFTKRVPKGHVFLVTEEE